MSARCERWTNTNELLGLRVDLRDVVVCGRPATASVLERRGEEWPACHEHADEAQRNGARVERWS